MIYNKIVFNRNNFYIKLSNFFKLNNYRAARTKNYRIPSVVTATRTVQRSSFTILNRYTPNILASLILSIVFVIDKKELFIVKMESNIEDLIQNSDQLFDQNQYQEALDVLNTFKGSSNADIKWRKSRALFKLSQQPSNKNKKSDLVNEAFEEIRDAIALNDNDFAIHKWMAIVLDAKSDLAGIKERVSQLENVKKHMLKAVELNSNDPTSWHILGKFAYGLADMAWYQRKIVTTFFATPPAGTYEEALEYFLRAEEKKPNFFSLNLLMLGKCYQRLKNDELAKKYLTLASNVQVLSEDDKQCKEAATELLKKY